jgi:acetoin utilization deacetylase AcuC-like enzyme
MMLNERDSSAGMRVNAFATYLHPHTVHTSESVDQIRFIGYSYPHFAKVRAALEQALAAYPTLPPRKADYAEYLRVHTEAYLSKLSQMAQGRMPKEPPRLSIECTGLQYCLPGYLYGLGGMLAAVDAMKAGHLTRAYGFALPGHHAYADWGHGYCLLNPQAAAARYAQSQGFKKILIIDWDLHHGDGTQAIFAHDPNVYCISIHSAADLYMASVHVMENGTTTRGMRVGHCNIPMLDEAFPDDFAKKTNFSGKFYRAPESMPVFRSALNQIPWKPDLIFIFSGYDSHKDDCGGGITNWTNADYKTLTQYVLDLAENAGCPVLSVHGGGYEIDVVLAAAREHVAMLANYP